MFTKKGGKSVDNQQDLKENLTTDDSDEVSHSTSSDKSVTLEDELLAARTENEQLEKQLDELKGQLARSVADLENFRRRSRKEKEDAVRFASVSLVESLLPVLDNFERALDAADGNEEAKGLLDGVEMVYRQLLQALSNSGLSLIEAVGMPFDPHIHNAVMQVESTEHDSGIIVEELQSGYRYHDRVIRPTMVKVSN